MMKSSRRPSETVRVIGHKEPPSRNASPVTELLPVKPIGCQVKIIEPGMNDKLQPADIIYIKESLF